MDKDKKITIVTHDGHFHTDEIFAVATLLIAFGDNTDTSVVRSRDKEIIEKGDYVVDVGGIYDSDRNHFDHHQTGGAGVRPNTIPYASFGLVWKKYGEQVCGNKEIAERIDEKLVQPIDAIDNGIQFMETKIKGVFLYEIAEFVEAFWPTWKEGDDIADEIFTSLVSLAKKLLNREIIKNQHKLEARLFVEEIYNNSENKKLIIFDQYYPAGEFLSKFLEPLFIIFPKENGEWIIHAIRDDDDSFVNRKNLPQSWAGKRDEELEKITGVNGAIFCHPGLFIAGAKTKEAILKLAELALNS